VSNQQGFVDLRLNHQRDQTAESFWPSFTDIMTVVVMIFMLAMLVLLLRNMELVKELRATMQAEHQAAELARSKDQERVALSARLSQARADASRLQKQLDAGEIKRRDQEKQLAQLGEHVQALSSERDTLRKQLQERQKDASALQAQLESATASLAQVKQSLKDSETRYTASQAALDVATAAGQRQEATIERLKADRQGTAKDLEQLRADYRSKVAELSGVLAKLETAKQSQSQLAESYDQLKTRYDRLVRPARSPKGRYVVDVRYAKSAGRVEIGMREPSQSSFQPVDRSTLESRLAKLVKAHPEGLYVKVIIPKDNGLSYSEAWRFTNALHAKYDYYYRERTGGKGERGTEAESGQ
jgi:predicted  nucleic acid-binding Zn-ribbon protein